MKTAKEKKAYLKQYCATHKKERAAYNKHYNATHQEERRAVAHRYWIANRARLCAYRKHYFATHREWFAHYWATHREQQRAYAQHARVIHHAARTTYFKRYWAANRTKVIEHYGGRCRWCGDKNHMFLQADHIHCDGASHRKELKKSSIWLWLIKNKYPKGFQILCANCHFVKSQYEKQTHKRPVTAAMVFGVARARQMARRIGSK
jgi:hypothetical protein